MNRLAVPAVALAIVGLVVLALLAVGATTSTKAAFVYQGDVTCDTEVHADDALALFSDSAGLAPATCDANGDVDCDGDRDTADGLLVLKYLAGVPQTISGCTPIGEQIVPGTPTPTGTSSATPSGTPLPSPSGAPCLAQANPDDSHEPNGSGDCAAPISHAVQTTDLHLQQNDTHDWYRLDFHNFTDGNCGKQLTVKVNPTAGDIAVQLFTPDINSAVTTVINDSGAAVPEFAHYAFPADCGNDNIVYVDVSLAAYPPNADYTITVALS